MSWSGLSNLALERTSGGCAWGSAPRAAQRERWAAGNSMRRSVRIAIIGFFAVCAAAVHAEQLQIQDGWSIKPLERAS